MVHIWYKITAFRNKTWYLNIMYIKISQAYNVKNLTMKIKLSLGLSKYLILIRSYVDKSLMNKYSFHDESWETVVHKHFILLFLITTSTPDLRLLTHNLKKTSIALYWFLEATGIPLIETPHTFRVYLKFNVKKMKLISGTVKRVFSKHINLTSGASVFQLEQYLFILSLDPELKNTHIHQLGRTQLTMSYLLLFYYKNMSYYYSWTSTFLSTFIKLRKAWTCEEFVRIDPLP